MLESVIECLKYNEPRGRSQWFIFRGQSVRTGFFFLFLKTLLILSRYI